MLWHKFLYFTWWWADYMIYKYPENNVNYSYNVNILIGYEYNQSGQQAHKADNICETMQNTRRLKKLWTFVACYWNSFIIN
jgi:hypothetical protein